MKMKNKKQMKTVVIILTLLISVGGLCLVLPKILNSNNNSNTLSNAGETDSSSSDITVTVNGKTYDENNIGEVYYSPIDENHIATDENGIMYADNEILVVAAEGVTREQIVELAKEYDAEVVGFIEQTGDYQWEFNCNYSMSEIEVILTELISKEIVLNASLNSISILPNDLSFDINPGDEWTMAGIDFIFPDITAEKAKRSWSFKAINGQAAWLYLMSIKNVVHPVKIGLIDDCFNIEHEDLGFAKDSNGIIQVFPQTIDGKPIDGQEADKRSPGSYVKSKASSHGTHVAGTMAASSKDSKGICGIYPYGDGNLYAFSWRAGSENDKVSAMAEKIWFSELILRNVKVINCSYGKTLSLYYNNEQTKNALKAEAEILGDFLQRLLNIGYDYVITVSSGNDSNDYVINLSCISDGKDLAYNDNGSDYSISYDSNGQPNLVRLDSDGNYYYDRKIDEDVTIPYLITGITGNDQVFHPADDVSDTTDHHLNSQYTSCLTAIDTQDVKDRIIVVGAVDSNYDITNYSNSGKRTDIYAPGGVDDKRVFSCYNDNTYGYMNGTSMAAPHVAGVAANVWSVNNNLSGKQVKIIILHSIHDNSKKEYPVVDAYKAIDNALKEIGLSDSYGESGAIMGWVVDESIVDSDGEPTKISNVDISVYKAGEFDALKLDNNDIIVKSDKYGHFELLLNEGTYNIKAYHKDYGEAIIENVVVKKNEVTYCEYVVLEEAFKDTRVLIPGEDTIRTATANTLNETSAAKYAQIVMDNEDLWLDPLNDMYLSDLDSQTCWFEDIDFDGELEFIVGGCNMETQGGISYFIFKFKGDKIIKVFEDYVNRDEAYSKLSSTGNIPSHLRTENPGFKEFGAEIVKDKTGNYKYIFPYIVSYIGTGYGISELKICNNSLTWSLIGGYVTNPEFEYLGSSGDVISEKELLKALSTWFDGTTVCYSVIGTIPCSYINKKLDSEWYKVAISSDFGLNDTYSAFVSGCYDGLSNEEKKEALIKSYNTYRIEESDMESELYAVFLADMSNDR